jgi:hypothetical protein
MPLRGGSDLQLRSGAPAGIADRGGMPVRVGYPRPRSARCHRQCSRCLLRRCDAGIAAPARSETPRGNPVMVTAITARHTLIRPTRVARPRLAAPGTCPIQGTSPDGQARKEKSPRARQRLSSSLPTYTPATTTCAGAVRCWPGLQDRLEVVRDRLRGRRQDDLPPGLIMTLTCGYMARSEGLEPPTF